MFFSKYLSENGFTPYVVTVDPQKASYKFRDESFLDHVNTINVFRTNTREVLKLYSKITTGKENEGIPQGFAGESKPGLIQKAARYIRGNFFIPDARKGWNKFALAEASRLIEEHGIKKIITTGPPHSTHLVGLKLKQQFNVKWIADFRDPWRELYYNKLLYRSARADKIDAKLESDVIQHADLVLTVGPGMKKLLEEKTTDKDKIKFIYNGFDEEVFTRHLPYSNKDSITILHVGLLGETQPIDGFLNALQSIIKDNETLGKKIELKFIGKVSQVITDDVKRICPSVKLTQLDYVQHKIAVQEMIKADLLLNSLPETGDASYMISGKMMEYIASGRPILALGNEHSDAANLLREFKYCSLFDRKNLSVIQDYLKEVLQRVYDGEDCSHSIKGIQYTRKATTVELAELLKKI